MSNATNMVSCPKCGAKVQQYYRAESIWCSSCGKSWNPKTRGRILGWIAASLLLLGLGGWYAYSWRETENRLELATAEVAELQTQLETGDWNQADMLTRLDELQTEVQDLKESHFLSQKKTQMELLQGQLDAVNSSANSAIQEHDNLSNFAQKLSAGQTAIAEKNLAQVEQMIEQVKEPLSWILTENFPKPWLEDHQTVQTNLAELESQFKDQTAQMASQFQQHEQTLKDVQTAIKGEQFSQADKSLAEVRNQFTSINSDRLNKDLESQFHDLRKEATSLKSTLTTAKRDAAIRDAVAEVARQLGEKKIREAEKTLETALKNHRGDVVLTSVKKWFKQAANKDEKITDKDKTALAQVSKDATDWRTAKSYASESSYRTFVKNHPNSLFAKEANDWIVDNEVAKIRNNKYGALPSPVRTPFNLGGSRIGNAGWTAMTVKNDTAYTLTVTFSGASKEQAVLSPHTSQTIRLKSGSYSATARVGNPSILPCYGTYDLSSSAPYGVTYYIETTRVPSYGLPRYGTNRRYGF